MRPSGVYSQVSRSTSSASIASACRATCKTFRCSHDPHRTGGGAKALPLPVLPPSHGVRCLNASVRRDNMMTVMSSPSSYRCNYPPTVVATSTAIMTRCHNSTQTPDPSSDEKQNANGGDEKATPQRVECQDRLLDPKIVLFLVIVGAVLSYYSMRGFFFNFLFLG